MYKYFIIAGDLDVKTEKIDTFSNVDSLEEIKLYLKKVVSGKEYNMECELGTLCGAGSCIVSFDEIKRMVEEGTYNIIEAECFNKEMIAIKFQEFNKEYSKKF